MAIVRVPPTVSSITLVTSGVLVPVDGLITVTSVEATDLCSPYSKGPGDSGVIDSAADTVRLQFPPSVLSITINGNVLSVGDVVDPNIISKDAASMLLDCKQIQSLFQLVSG